MVFASTCEHVSSAFIFASTSSDQISPVPELSFSTHPLGRGWTRAGEKKSPG